MDHLEKRSGKDCFIILVLPGHGTSNITQITFGFVAWVNEKSFAFDFVVIKSDSADFDYDPTNSSSDLGFSISKFSLDNMLDNNRTLKELATPNIMCQPWFIRYPNLEQAQSYELKSRLIHLLPTFYGLVGEDPRKHLKEFHGARNLISNMQFGIGESTASKVVNKITELTSLVRQLAIGQHHISPLVRTTTNYVACTAEFLRGFGQEDGYKQHSFLKNCDCFNSGLANTDCTIGHHCDSTIVQRFRTDSLSNHS
ncbi:hypothetical protein CR513_20429, partial [Mucuna pruriens]